MTQSNVFVIRHGETDYNLKHQLQGRGIDAPLNETGLRQAEAVADYLDRYPVHRIISSNLLRARQTALPSVERRGKSLGFHPDLDEMNFGDFEGQNLNRISAQISKIHERWKSGETSFTIPGGESPEEVLDRANKRIHSYLEEMRGKTVVFILHGRLIRILLSVWTGLGLRNMHQISHTNGGVNQLYWDGSGFKVVYLNKTDHLVNPIEIE